MVAHRTPDYAPDETLRKIAEFDAAIADAKASSVVDFRRFEAMTRRRKELAFLLADFLRG